MMMDAVIGLGCYYIAWQNLSLLLSDHSQALWYELLLLVLTALLLVGVGTWRLVLAWKRYKAEKDNPSSDA